ncbi:unnamed protein product [Zymoseptoria tritici ST99CH_1A5]|uniref:Uncharacterized protein n=1 Tax=Zymoseptoria tritici ST99CH_1A5 TaxID=1276529 RepID=A0A1Y6LH01_ZYMTR|nr:unnamed protein product [Zymoseptoria tritici ST99CH_3D1]SMY22678.1 unnamed protein product [Zymoseptoria tritici ST99CH_1A5]
MAAFHAMPQESLHFVGEHHSLEDQLNLLLVLPGATQCPLGNVGRIGKTLFVSHVISNYTLHDSSFDDTSEIIMPERWDSTKECLNPSDTIGVWQPLQSVFNG